MLHDQERRALREIERNLARQDPGLAVRLSGRPAETPSFPTLSVVCGLAYIALPIITLLYGGTGTAVVGALFAAAVLVVLVHRRGHRRE